MNAPIGEVKDLQAGADPQARASDPYSSAWVTANAGAGKTHVLVQRVLRLLLEGAAPSRILCLTFTKSAAANMAERVFKTLANWTTIEDDALAIAIEKSGAPRPDASRLALARRLFARTIESPGGLRIETIHSFCGRLLRMFPFEANVAAGFRVVEEREAMQLLNAAREKALSGLALDPNGASTLRALVIETGRQGLDALLAHTLALRATINDAVSHWGGVAAYGRALRTRLGLAPHESVAALEEDILAGLGDRAARLRVAARLDEGSATDQDRGAALRDSVLSTDRANALADYFSVFFTLDDKPRGGESGRLVTKALENKHPGLNGLLRREQQRIVALREKLKAARSAERALSLVIVAERVLAAYGRLKAERGLLDFDDLIERVNALLERADAAWVLYKLDSGIDHILVDEAQDTSREQWEILKKIVEDFTSGKSARETARTFFAVGDDKQSIFSFQGAEPRMFAAMRRLLHRRHDDANMPFAPVSLTLSYRSSKVVLDSIDSVFSIEKTWRGLAEDAAPPTHVAFRTYLPGVVEVWPPVGGDKEALYSDWRLPLDASTARDPPVVLARRIAAVIADWLKPASTARTYDKEMGKPRPIRPGDILILVRTRNAFFEAMIRALKDADITTLGADRLLLADHIAVMDLVAAGKAALSADDDLALAAALKSPLFGFADDDLIAVAPARQGSLAGALASRPEQKYRAAAQRLAIWRQRARAFSPYEFYARLLGEEGGKRAMLGRLGPEAGDAMEEFLSLALSFEKRRPPSLAAFLAEAEASDVSIKRDMEEGGDAVRVMTVHAAKGLEAPIVFLPDTCSAGAREESGLLVLPGEREEIDPPFIVWTSRKAEDPAVIAAARERQRAEARGEHRRLLYVAMTRAAERLIIAGYHGVNGPAEDCWREMILAGLGGVLVPAPAPWSAEETILRLGEGASEAAAAERQERAPEPTPPAWLAAPAPTGPPPLSLSVSGAAPASAWRAPARSENRLEAGRLSHSLLQYLPEIPPERRLEAGRRYLAGRSLAVDAAEQALILERALAILDQADLADLFGPASRPEVPVTAEFPRDGAPPISFAGRIDRLAVHADHVAIADFKSGAPGPADAAPPDYVMQLALYRAALSPLYPDRPVRAFLIWLDSPKSVEISPASLDAAFAARLTAA